MASRIGGSPLILRAHRSFEPTRWQDQTLATIYRLLHNQALARHRLDRPTKPTADRSAASSDCSIALGGVPT
jgi:hypothetical protein